MPPPRAAPRDLIRGMYRRLFRAWGRQHWWPADSAFEMIAGAYLTQNTAWTNVEKAMANLRRARALSLAGVRRLPEAELAQLIRSSGYFRQKAARLKKFVQYLDAHYAGSLPRLFAQPTAKLREELLSLNGVGAETADSILLYAGGHPVFVVDAYTRRILDRHGVLPYNSRYEDIRAVCEAALGDAEFVAEACAIEPPHLAATPDSHLGIENRELESSSGACHPPSKMSTASRPASAQVFSEMHGLFVGVAKNYCLKSKAHCERCPLGPLLTPAQRRKLKAAGLLG